MTFIDEQGFNVHPSDAAASTFPIDRSEAVRQSGGRDPAGGTRARAR